MTKDVRIIDTFQDIEALMDNIVLTMNHIFGIVYPLVMTCKYVLQRADKDFMVNYG